MTPATSPAASGREPLALLLGVGTVLVISGATPPSGHQIWLLETFPVMVGAVVLTATYRWFRFTPLSYRLIAIHAMILIWGGYYTYADNPLFDWLQESFDLSRNYYDRLGHFAQGFIPAILARELLLRKSPLVPGKWLFFLVCCVALSISACYEFLEWWVALATGEAAEAFLALQGDVWDTQWDMFLALTGAIIGQLLLAPLHDRQIRALTG